MSIVQGNGGVSPGAVLSLLLGRFTRGLPKGYRGLNEWLKELQTVGLKPITTVVGGPMEEPGGIQELFDIQEGGEGRILNTEKLQHVPKLVTTYDQLEDGAIYTVGANNSDVIRQMRQQVGHMLQACKDQLGCAMLSYADASKPGVCRLRPDLRVLKGPKGIDSMELDAVVTCDDTAYIASHKLRITGPKPVKAIAETVKLVAQRSQDPSYSGTTYAKFRQFPNLVAVLGAEKVESKSEELISKACFENKVPITKGACEALATSKW
ncbi:hypothetical protein VOLCADRAFT_90532 [Volvox carteri f. nagariensis]|uniref:Uncharacterized protein n=1 Tax=Volvox carteri f. nagariensis TaxID=3068 RepID=D8TUM9_VOLCA|nr:uncharacterized protein VOLCADRAFT_90532 [Volvox carteri f. nagariensis]EFJ48852.1 hypothetical protein VOLCADRAFT_90532 [Volvox carteri f. nagariensis]|eukprot:XP_002950184.1 hypothetical protein VOLCADRAFT_90532 [Volvox carteri f. nagariensis]